MVRKRWWAGALAGSLALLSGVPAQAGVGVSVGIGFGGPCYRPYYYRPYWYGYPYYYPRVVVAPSVVVDPAPSVYVAPPPTVVVPATPAAAPVQQQAPSYNPPPPTPVAPPPPAPGLPSAPTPVASTPNNTAVRANWSPEAEAVMRHIGQGDERSRTDAILHYGRARDIRALEPLTYTLTSDQNPGVRDAAARALGLIGSPSSLEALQRAAMADDDRDVRRSAGYAADVIRSNLRR
jgi:hypothetical protein